MVYKKFIMKTIILGDMAVGKTSLLHRFVSGKFLETYKMTIGSEFSIKKINFDEV